VVIIALQYYSKYYILLCMFHHEKINLDILNKRAYNLRWATVPHGTIPLTAADPDFPVAPEIVDAICRFAKEGYFSYGPSDGLPEFKESMAEYFRTKRKINAKPGFILPVDSAAWGIALICKAFLAAGDEAIIFDPVDFLFRYSIEAVGGIAVSFAIPPGTSDLEFEKLESLITHKTKLICLCNPLNPTGKVFTKKELTSLAAIAHKHNLIVLSDEIWSDITFSPHEFTSFASLDDDTNNRTITVTGFSKSYGLAGLRIGAVMASNAVHYKMLLDASMHNSTIHGANLISQVAACAALDKCGYWLDAFLLHLQSMRNLCVDGLNSVNGFKCIAPEGCYVAFANITGTNRSSSEVRDMLFNDAKVAVVPGLKEWFGGGAEGYIRLSFATSEDILSEALQRISITMNKI
jgi:aspartate/methionine/tyrosine aminotransferase